MSSFHVGLNLNRIDILCVNKKSSSSLWILAPKNDLKEAKKAQNDCVFHGANNVLLY